MSGTGDFLKAAAQAPSERAEIFLRKHFPKEWTTHTVNELTILLDAERAEADDLLDECLAVLEGPIYEGFGEHPDDKLADIIDSASPHRTAAAWEAKRRRVIAGLRARGRA